MQSWYEWRLWPDWYHSRESFPKALYLFIFSNVKFYDRLTGILKTLLIVKQKSLNKEDKDNSQKKTLHALLVTKHKFCQTFDHMRKSYTVSEAHWIETPTENKCWVCWLSAETLTVDLPDGSKVICETPLWNNKFHKKKNKEQKNKTKQASKNQTETKHTNQKTRKAPQPQQNSWVSLPSLHASCMLIE